MILSRLRNCMLKEICLFAERNNLRASIELRSYNEHFQPWVFEMGDCVGVRDQPKPAKLGIQISNADGKASKKFCTRKGMVGTRFRHYKVEQRNAILTFHYLQLYHSSFWGNETPFGNHT